MPWEALNQLGLTWEELWLTVVTAAGIYGTVIVLSQLFGQRQFATMSSYDLAFIFALGSLVGRVILVRTSLLGAIIGLSTMFVLHAITGQLHHTISRIHSASQNRPVLLVADGEILQSGLRRARMSQAEVCLSLRLHGIGSCQDVAALILERNGQVSLVEKGQRLDRAIFQEVLGKERLEWAGTDAV